MPETDENGAPIKPNYKGLKRLNPFFYQGENWVHWNMTISNRATGWLSEVHHLRLREALLHTLVRYSLICPVYCLMPDHGHFLWGGLEKESDQLKAVSFFRQEWNRILGDDDGGGRFELQHQPFDHVLRPDEIDRDVGFKKVAGYILENPVRSGLVMDFREWKFLGSVVPTFPRIDPRDSDFWDRYWKLHYSLRESLQK